MYSHPDDGSINCTKFHVQWYKAKVWETLVWDMTNHSNSLDKYNLVTRYVCNFNYVSEQTYQTWNLELLRTNVGFGCQDWPKPYGKLVDTFVENNNWFHSLQWHEL